MEIEAQAILAASRKLEENLVRAAGLILAHPGKVIVSGLGKSGLIGRSLSATFQSTGTPSLFMHSAEAAHGDLGVCQNSDPVVLVSKSGTTPELLDLIDPLRDLRCPLIGIIGNPQSPLAAEMDVVLDASVQREADPEGFTPTASTATALAVGHALAVALMEARGFSSERFSRSHAGGQLGRSLRAIVRDIMHSGDEVAWVAPGDSLKQVVLEMTRRPLGAACVISPDRGLLGLITDGDLRRALEKHDDIRILQAAQVMTASPITIDPGALIHDALRVMEDRPSQISVLPVVDSGTLQCLGLVRIHDMYQRFR
jgi:arabinose-5-phosphate isomerase